MPHVLLKWNNFFYIKKNSLIKSLRPHRRKINQKLGSKLNP